MPECQTTIFISKLGSSVSEQERHSPRTGSRVSAHSARSTSLLNVIDSHFKLLPPKITQSAGGTKADKQLWKKGLYSAAQSKSQPPNYPVQDQAKKRDTLKEPPYCSP